jgi:hypothetical protein
MLLGHIVWILQTHHRLTEGLSDLANPDVAHGFQELWILTIFRECVDIYLVIIIKAVLPSYIPAIHHITCTCWNIDQSSESNQI